MTSAMTRARTHERGLTMVELMVALVLGLLLLGATIQIFEANRQTHRLGESLARLQDNGRFAIQSLAQDMRMSGFLNCGSRRGRLGDRLIFNYVNSTGLDDLGAIDISDPVEAMTQTISAVNDDEVLADPPDGFTVCDADGADGVICQASDAMRVVRGSQNSKLLIADMVDGSENPDPEAALIVGSGFDNAENTPMLVADCQGGDIFLAGDTTASADSPASIEPTTALASAYSVGASVTPIVASTYFVGFEDGNTIPSLYRRNDLDLDEDPVEIVRGVEAMQIMLGLDTDDDSFLDDYAEPDAGTDWTEVIAVRVMLLLKSENALATDTPVPINFFDGTIDGDGAYVFNAINADEENQDRRLRIVYTSTITLRNYMP